MRILIISSVYTGDSGGVATHVVTLARGLVRYIPDATVHVVTLASRDESLAPQEIRNGYIRKNRGRLEEWKLERRTTHEFNGRRVVLGRFVSFCLENWRKLLPDVIHVHDFDSLQIGWLLRTVYPRTRLILTTHRAPTDWRPERVRENEKDCYMEAIRLKNCLDRIVVPSKASATILREQGFNNISVIPHGITPYLRSLDSDESTLATLNLPSDAELIFCPCRNDEHKDLLVLVKAAGDLHEQINKPTVFLLTSNPEDIDPSQALELLDLRTIAANHRLTEGKDIIFTTPFQWGVPLATVYRRAKAVVVPSIHESFGQNVLDAFLFEKPVIASHSAALKDLITHEDEHVPRVVESGGRRLG